MATDFDSRILDAAALTSYILRHKCSPAEAQIALGLVSGFLCDQYALKVDDYMHVLRHNTLQLLEDPLLLSRVKERLHNVSTGRGLPPLETEPAEYRHEVGDLLHKHKHQH